jgi:hypothetical protein
MTAAQQALVDARAARDAAQAKSTRLKEKVLEHDHIYGERCAAEAAARDAHRSTAGLAAAADGPPSPKIKADVEETRRRWRQAKDELEEHVVQGEGLTNIAASSATELDRLQKCVHVAVSLVAQEQAAPLRERALQIATELGVLLGRHRALARLALQAESDAGTKGDPIPGSSTGESSEFSRSIEAAIAGPPAESITSEDLVPATPAKERAA